MIFLSHVNQILKMSRVYQGRHVEIKYQIPHSSNHDRSLRPMPAKDPQLREDQSRETFEPGRGRHSQHRRGKNLWTPLVEWQAGRQAAMAAKAHNRADLHLNGRLNRRQREGRRVMRV